MVIFKNNNMQLVNQVLFLLGLAILVSCNTQKETAGTVEPEPQPQQDRREMMRERMAQRYQELKEILALSPEQETQFDKINQEFMANMQAMRQSGQGDREEMRQMNTERRNAIQEILSDEQMEVYNAYMAEQRENRQGRGRGRG
jgi:Spy/CpxP family protein refolding chaperone